MYIEKKILDIMEEMKEKEVEGNERIIKSNCQKILYIINNC